MNREGIVADNDLFDQRPRALQRLRVGAKVAAA